MVLIPLHRIVHYFEHFLVKVVGVRSMQREAGEHVAYKVLRKRVNLPIMHHLEKLVIWCAHKRSESGPGACHSYVMYNLHLVRVLPTEIN